MKFTKPRGTEDWLPPKSNNFRQIVNYLLNVANLYGYQEIKTPIFENSELFIRSVGNTSDIVQKEFYNFKDKGDREMVLRPEGTAGVIRAVVEEKLINKLPPPIKLCYCGEMFRYERPQSGRLRQFNQFGVECINTDSIYDDIDTLAFAISILKTLGLKNFKVSINNIGSIEARNKWIVELKEYFNKYKDQLTTISQYRIDTNPLRILDDKEDGIKDFVKNAPTIDKYLSEEEKQDFEKIKSCLKVMNIDFNVDKTLVRGLDYYTNFIFEINSTDERLAGQPTIVGGGRYSNLVKELGGDDVKCVGFALGIERLLLILEYENIKIDNPNSVDVVVAPLSETFLPTALITLSILRSSNISAVCKFNATKLVKHFDYAKATNAKFVLIIGEKELTNKQVIIKDQKTLTQENVAIDKIVEFVKNKLK